MTISLTLLFHMFLKLLPHSLQAFGHGAVRLIAERLRNFLITRTTKKPWIVTFTLLTHIVPGKKALIRTVTVCFGSFIPKGEIFPVCSRKVLNFHSAQDLWNQELNILLHFTWQLTEYELRFPRGSILASSLLARSSRLWQFSLRLGHTRVLTAV